MTLGTLPESKVPREDELEREEKFDSGRVILVAIDHGPNSHTAFAWALDQFVTHIDTVHLLHVLPKSVGAGDNSPMYDATQLLFDRLTKEAHRKRCNVRVVPVLKTGEPGKEIVAEATRSKAVAVIMGCRNLSSFKSLLVGSSTDYCLRYSPAPLIIVPNQFQAEPSTSAEDEVEERDVALKVDGR